jgi:hypothetical protein
LSGAVDLPFVLWGANDRAVSSSFGHHPELGAVRRRNNKLGIGAHTLQHAIACVSEDLKERENDNEAEAEVRESARLITGVALIDADYRFCRAKQLR